VTDWCYCFQSVVKVDRNVAEPSYWVS